MLCSGNGLSRGMHTRVQGSVQRPLDITSLRIDQAERMGLQLADALISPTAYMTAFLKQRAWRLPKTSLVIPNVLPPPDGDTPSQARHKPLLALTSCTV